MQDCYNIRKLMNDSFKKTKNKVKQDYSKNIIKQIEFEEETILGIHPAIKLLILFTGVILVFTSFILIHFSM